MYRLFALLLEGFCFFLNKLSITFLTNLSEAKEKATLVKVAFGEYKKVIKFIPYE